MLSVLLQLSAVLINVFIFCITIHKLKYNLKITYIILLIFQAIYVLPIVFGWFLGVQDYSNKFPGFEEALNDTTTDVYYSLFVIIMSLGLFFLGSKNNGIVVTDIKENISNIKVKREYYIIFVLLMFVPFIVALLAPSPEKYLFEYAYFQRNSDISTELELWYHQNVLRIAGVISLLAIILTKLFSKNTFLNNVIIYSAAIITGILNGKRTLFAFIILGILAVDILKAPKGKFPFKKIITSILIILFTFILYAFVLNKQMVDVSTLDNIRLYFFRDVDVKYAIYSLLNPNLYKILDYWGQSYLYNISFYIPRSWWLDKPYPFDIYVTSSVLNLPTNTVLPWSFQTSFFGEALANLSWSGVAFSLLIIDKFIRVSERTENPFIILLCIFIIVRSFMNHFGSYSLFIIIWVILMIHHKFKNKTKNVYNKIVQ